MTACTGWRGGEGQRPNDTQAGSKGNKEHGQQRAASAASASSVHKQQDESRAKYACMAQGGGGGAPSAPKKNGIRRGVLMLSSLAVVTVLFRPQLRLVGGSFLGEGTVVDAEDVQISQRHLPWHTAIYYEAMTSPVPGYSRSRAAEAVQPTTWKCGDETTRSGPRTLVAFVHVYKTGERQPRAPRARFRRS